MLELSGLNIGAVIVAWFISIIVGSFWYSPKGFGKQWSKMSGVDMMKMPKDAANKAIVAVAISSIVQVVVLAVVVKSLHVKSVLDAIIVAVILWAGLVAATTVGNNLYLRKSWRFWWLNASFFLPVMIVNSVLFAVWK